MVVVCFLVAFAAGVGVGLALRHRPAVPPVHSVLVRELNLTPEQGKKVLEIWSRARDALREQFHEQREAVAKQRDEAIRALLTKEQTPRYEQITADYQRKRDELGEQRKKLFRQAVEQTKEILTEDQRARYEEILEEWRKMRPHGRRPHGTRPSEGTTGSNRPSERQQ